MIQVVLDLMGTMITLILNLNRFAMYSDGESQKLIRANKWSLKKDGKAYKWAYK